MKKIEKLVTLVLLVFTLSLIAVSCTDDSKIIDNEKDLEQFEKIDKDEVDDEDI